MVLKNCPVTLTTSEAIKPWSTTIPYHTGVDISCNKCYAICNGVITYADRDIDGTYSIILEYDAYTAFRYCNLFKVDVSPGSAVRKSTLLGNCRVLHFEQLSTYNEENKNWVVRNLKKTYYKVNPLNALQNDSTYSGRTISKYDGIYVPMKLDEFQESEFSGDRG